jgi:hypothetical protein
VKFLNGSKNISRLPNTNIFQYLENTLKKEDVDNLSIQQKMDECRDKKFKFIKKLRKLTKLGSANRKIKRRLYWLEFQSKF